MSAHTTRKLFCCGCEQEVDARLTDGAEIYPHRADLADLPYWRCDGCGNWVGCHHKAKNRTDPLGVIPTPALKKARSHIHAIMDPLWQSGRLPRSEVYRRLSDRLGWRFHTAKIRDLPEARRVYRLVQEIARST